MKKRFKSFLTVLCATVLAFNLMSVNAFAATENTAFLAYADESWTYSYFGDAVDTGLVATDVEVTGAGQYTVGLDFTGTEAGKASGIAFTAPMIHGWEEKNPGYIMQIDSFKVNGKEVALTKNYTSCDDDSKFQTRSNVYNTWVSELPADARTVDGSLDDASAVIVDPALFAEVETLSVTFTLLDADGNGAAAEASVPKTGVASMALIFALGAVASGSVVLKKKVK